MPSPTPPDKNHFICPHCGRTFDDQPVFAEHEAECSLAAAATPKPHGLNDAERGDDREWKSIP